MNRAGNVIGAAIAALGLAALLLGAGLAFAPGSARAAPAPEFTLEFPNLATGVPQTQSGTFSVDRAADLVSFDWLEQVGVLAPGAVQLDVTTCDSAGACIDPRNLPTPVPFAAGPATFTVTAELIGPVGNGQTGSLVGRMTFVAQDDVPGEGGGGLAATGFVAAPWIAAGLAGIAVGALVVALARRPRRQAADDLS